MMAFENSSKRFGLKSKVGLLYLLKFLTEELSTFQKQAVIKESNDD